MWRKFTNAFVCRWYPWLVLETLWEISEMERMQITFIFSCAYSCWIIILINIRIVRLGLQSNKDCFSLCGSNHHRHQYLLCRILCHNGISSVLVRLLWRHRIWCALSHLHHVPPLTHVCLDGVYGTFQIWGTTTSCYLFICLFIYLFLLNNPICYCFCISLFCIVFCML